MTNEDIGYDTKTEKSRVRQGSDKHVYRNGIYLNMNKNQRCLYSMERFIRFTQIFFFNRGFVCFD